MLSLVLVSPILPLWFISIHGLGKSIGDFGAAAVFFALMMFGAIFTSLSMFFGHDTDGGGDVGHGDIGHGDMHGDHGGDHNEAPSKFSLRTILFFITGFGAIGFMVQLKTKDAFISSMAGVIGGISMAMIGYYIVTLFYKQQATSIMTNDDLIGSNGEVITTIHKDSIGEVLITSGMGRLINKSAVSDDGSEIKSGTSVKVLKVSGSHVIVKRV